MSGVDPCYGDECEPFDTYNYDSGIKPVRERHVSAVVSWPQHKVVHRPGVVLLIVAMVISFIGGCFVSCLRQAESDHFRSSLAPPPAWTEDVQPKRDTRLCPSHPAIVLAQPWPSIPLPGRVWVTGPPRGRPAIVSQNYVGWWWNWRYGLKGVGYYLEPKPLC